MANRIDQAQIKGAAVANEFNRQFKPNTPCFYQPIRGEDKWYPTRTRSEAWLLGHGEPVVKVDGASGCAKLYTTTNLANACNAVDRYNMWLLQEGLHRDQQAKAGGAD